MSKVTFRRWVVAMIETVICTIALGAALVVLCYIVSFLFRAFGIG